MKTNSIPLSVLSPCDSSREIWRQLNELRGLCSGLSWFDCDLRALVLRLEKLRDDLAMHYASEWGADGGLRKASINGNVDRERLSLFLEEQNQVYGMISDLASDVEKLLPVSNVTPDVLRRVMDRFRMFDALLISHESRKSTAIHGQ